MAEERVRRRLAAILAADVVGYSRLIRADEEGTLARLHSLRAEFIDPNITKYDGRIVKLMGDGMLAEFPSVVDAVRNAVELQKAVAEQQTDVPEDRRIVFRVGVNLGDVVIEGDDIHGDGVNVAARLEALADPGGICISGAVYDQVRDRLDQYFEDMGEREVKNIDRPVRIWRWVNALHEAGAKTATIDKPLPLPDKPSIAVLPFENMSGDPEQEYFSDGICEDVITDLSKVAGLIVIARNSSFAYKGQNVDIRTVGQELGVSSVLEGSIRRSGNRVRITAQLIDSASGAHLWAERYDREITELFAVQDDVTRRIVEALEVRLTSVEKERISGYPTINIEAHDLFLRGRQLLFGPNMNATTFGQSIALLEEAINLDPEYGAPYAALAMANIIDFQNRWVNDPVEALKEATRYAEVAILKSPKDPFSYYVAAVAAGFRREADQAKENLETALKLSPNFALAINARGLALMYAGESEAAVPYIERAMRLDPGMKWQYLHFLGLAHLLAGMFETAAAELRERIRYVPDTDRSRAYLASALGYMGEFDEAKCIWKELKTINPKYSVETHLESLPFRRHEDIDTIREGLGKAGLVD